MRYLWKFCLLTICCAFPALAQDVKCSTHTRNWTHPLSSNICPDDYQAWLKGREHDRWYKDKYVWITDAAMAGALTGDTYTTSQALGRGAMEQNPLVGRHPSNARIAAFGAGGYLIYFGLNILDYKLSHNDPSKAWRTFGRFAVPAIATGIHGILAIHNSHVCEKGCG